MSEKTLAKLIFSNECHSMHVQIKMPIIASHSFKICHWLKTKSLTNNNYENNKQNNIMTVNIYFLLRAINIITILNC